MNNQKLKKGTIQKVEDDRITLFNLDGACAESFPIHADFAEEMRKNIQPQEKIFYVIEGDELVGIGLESEAPEDLKNFYDMMPKEMECSSWIKNSPEKQEKEERFA